MPKGLMGWAVLLAFVAVVYFVYKNYVRTHVK